MIQKLLIPEIPTKIEQTTIIKHTKQNDVSIKFESDITVWVFLNYLVITVIFIRTNTKSCLPRSLSPQYPVELCL